MAKTVFAERALLPSGWATDVRVTLNGHEIGSVTAEVPAEAGDDRVSLLVPGMPNLHSHAFQRGMAGLAERRGPNADSFWTWREVMYQFALGLSPDEMQAVAEMAYVEMLETGFTRVGEFHYLHHAAEGRYENPAEMSLRIIAAAQATGINLTHLPVFYAHSDFGGKPPGAGQRRFIHGLEDYATLLEKCRKSLTRPFDRLGIAPHSLRAVAADELQHLVAQFGDGPIHIHIAEQLREVKDSVAYSGKRPVEWLLEHQPVDQRWCLIHATHLTDAERTGIARSGAVAGLCPITEANLGDGLFPAAEFLQEQGRIGIGSDSNVEISAPAELRLLEYGQRLFHRARNVLSAGEGSTGQALFAACLNGGAQALAAPEPVIAPGAPADLVALKDDWGFRPRGDVDIDRWIFATGTQVSDVWVAGKHVVEQGRHKNRDTVARRFAGAMQKFMA